MKRYITLTVLLVALCLPGAAMACLGLQTAKKPLTISIVPQLPVPTIYAKWGPFLSYVGNASGECFDLILQPTIPDFEKYLWTAAPDMAYTNPYHAVMAHRRLGYLPAIADGSELLTGILVVRQDSNIRSLADLRQQKIDFPAPNAFAASLLLRAYLAKEQVNIQPVYVRSHSNVYRGVILGDAAAGGGVNKTLRGEPADVRDQLRVIYETPGFRGHPIVFNPRVSRDLRLKIVKTILDMSRTEEGRALLADIQIPEPMSVTYDKDYRPLEKLGFEKLVKEDGNQ